MRGYVYACLLVKKEEKKIKQQKNELNISLHDIY